MDYIDKVYIDLKDRSPGKFLMSSLENPDAFIAAVKFLIDGGWLTNFHWDKDYQIFTIEEKFPFQTEKTKPQKFLKPDWYENNKKALEESRPD